jgi:hypothetical protein
MVAVGHASTDLMCILLSSAAMLSVGLGLVMHASR